MSVAGALFAGALFAGCKVGAPVNVVDREVPGAVRDTGCNEPGTFGAPRSRQICCSLRVRYRLDRSFSASVGAEGEVGSQCQPAARVVIHQYFDLPDTASGRNGMIRKRRSGEPRRSPRSCDRSGSYRTISAALRLPADVGRSRQKAIWPQLAI
jgi:hypothetical protein